MPTDGYFYTFLTNYSDTQVSFDNLTIHHKQGVLRAQYDYYPYGLAWGRQLPIDPATAYNETYNSSEFNYNEWGTEGLDLNYFEARYYDPVLGRFHAPDPSTKLLVGAQRKLRDLSLGSAENQQFHSPYMANFDDPANHIDPDGRASKFQQFLNSDLGMICQTLVVQTILGGVLSGTATGSNIAQAAQALATLGGTISTVSSIRGGGMAQLTQSATVQDAAAQPQPNPKPISTETPQAAPNSPGTLEPVAVDATSSYTNNAKQGIQVHYGDGKQISLTATTDDELYGALAASGNDPFVKDVVDAIKHMRQADEESGNNILQALAESDKITNIVESKVFNIEQDYDPNSRTANWHPELGLMTMTKDAGGKRHPIDPISDLPLKNIGELKESVNQSPAVGLYHELIHSWRHQNHPFGMQIIRYNIKSKKWENLEEKKVISIENRATKLMKNEASRVGYTQDFREIRRVTTGSTKHK